MIAPSGAAAVRPPAAGSTVSPATLQMFSALLEARTGQRIASYRSWRIDTALKSLMRDRGLGTLDQLVALLRDGRDRPLADEVVDALLNQETSFFRDAPIFDLVVEAVAAAERRGHRARIWCAGCATGQEPQSLAMLFAERAEAGAPMPEILATDVSDLALARARAGRYTQFEIQRGLPIRQLMRWFDGEGGEWTIKPDLARRVMFRQHNLVADRPPAGAFDVILCRNVLLYLSPETKQAVFRTFADALRADGLLVLGAGETVIGQTQLFQPSRTLRGFYERSAVPTSDGDIAGAS
ncbi:chemotaxis protein CheR [Arthrobacter sp. TPD3018]|uniref:CheR family methyltransferase n=1 Tax=Bacteria TaxID=2 RepID=UPI000D522D16|nr:MULTISPECIES: protein-glutamate O-methyltransferase CheR [Bacteria]PVE59613.1 chemotaxis protein CheR [Sphingomonas sp. TPD3009]PVE61129.1 chemotaxis protein CheR [Arthrobacter sp. TPD3018]PVE85952.1 chemotaxis protein CheR [Sphingomonas melonis]